jgi:hypothetical protein
MGVIPMVSREELRVRSEELWYAFLSKKAFSIEKIMINICNKSIAKQCKPNLLPVPCSLLPTIYSRSFS